MTQSYVPKRKPGRPPKAEFIKVALRDVDVVRGIAQDVSVDSISFKEKLLDWVQYGVPSLGGKDLEQAIIAALADCGSSVIQRYLSDGKQTDISTLLSFLLNEKLVRFDSPPSPGDLLFLQNDGRLTTFRIVTQVVASDPPALPENSWPTWRHNLLHHQRMVQPKTYRVFLHKEDEPVTSWYAVAKIDT